MARNHSSLRSDDTPVTQEPVKDDNSKQQTPFTQEQLKRNQQVGFTPAEKSI
ncbi:hypothetical protein A2U01_0009305, partial [Trifolium medium]|nr:hypothetical protein [Trifolium medium]